MTGYAVQRPTKYCHACGAVIDAEAVVCVKCGVKQPGGSLRTADSPKRIAAALALALFLPCLGAHRFYVGKVGTGFLQLVTLGGVGIWWLIDCVMLILGEFTDSDGNKIDIWV